MQLTTRFQTVRCVSVISLLAACQAPHSGDVQLASAALVPGTPTLIAPSGGTTSLPDFQWNSTAGADQYRLYVADSSANPKIDVTVDAATAGCAAGPPAVCTYNPNMALADGAGVFWIAGISLIDGAGPWSNGLQFNVGAGILATLVSPVGAISDTTPDYVWNAVVGATSYRVWIESAGSIPLIDQTLTPGEVGCASEMGTCTFTTGTALNNGNGQWWVQVQPGGRWSSPLSFSVNTTIGPAIQVSPVGDITDDNTPTFTWNAVAGASDYVLWVADSGAEPRYQITYTAAEAGCAGGVGNCSVTPATALANGAAQWFVQTNIGGLWSAGLDFNVITTCIGGCDDMLPCTLDVCDPMAGCTHTDDDTLPCSDSNTCTTTDACVSGICQATEPDRTSCSVVSGFSPTGSISNYSPTYTWDHVAGVDDYRLWIDDDNTGAAIFTQTTTCVASPCSLTPAFTLPNGQFVWYIQTPPFVDGTFTGTKNGPWSPVQTAQIGVSTAPTLVAPLGVIATSTPTYQWNAIAGTGHEYELYVSGNGSPGLISVTISEATAGCPGGAGVCSYTSATPLPTGAGSFWVRANPPAFVGDVGGPWSAQGDFTAP